MRVRVILRAKLIKFLVSIVRKPQRIWMGIGFSLANPIRIPPPPIFRAGPDLRGVFDETIFSALHFSQEKKTPLLRLRWPRVQTSRKVVRRRIPGQDKQCREERKDYHMIEEQRMCFNQRSLDLPILRFWLCEIKLTETGGLLLLGRSPRSTHIHLTARNSYNFQLFYSLLRERRRCR